MLFPIGDDNQGRLTTPFVVYLIIIINAVVFLLFQQATSTEAGAEFTYAYSVVPYEITHNVDLVSPMRVPGGPVIPQFPGPNPIWLTIFTSMFMHGSWIHILGNMLYLWIFGNNVEDALGKLRFLAWYLAAGVAATALQTFVTLTFGTVRDGSSPNMAASGAIAGGLRPCA